MTTQFGFAATNIFPASPFASMYWRKRVAIGITSPSPTEQFAPTVRDGGDAVDSGAAVFE